MEKTEKVVKTDQEWRQLLDADQYEVLREAATEPPWAGKYVSEKGDGIYRCAGCGNELFSSETKFESGSGWPSFFQPVSDEAVYTERDSSLGMTRDEALCATCDSHLGHVFPDGPPPTGLRWCINSLALEHEPDGAGS
jgi:peptide-methionine (R)-S-oxide reductase